jgi:lipoate-protein ligase A
LKSGASHPRHWLLLLSGRGDPAWNMALDEALLEAVSRLGQPVLRLYGWAVPAATFGYFQRYADVARMTPLRPLVRRPTGGGLVPHGSDWTYSLVFPPSHEWYRLRAAESYQRLHEWIRASFVRLGVASELSPDSRKEQPGQCFAGAERFDLVSQGRKVAGAAQRRSRCGLLIQGSIQPTPSGMPRSDWEQAFSATAEEAWKIEWKSPRSSSSIEEHARRLAETKFSRREHNERR